MQHLALLKRQMRFKAIAVIEVGSMAVGVLVGVVMALLRLSILVFSRFRALRRRSRRFLLTGTGVSLEAAIAYQRQRNRSDSHIRSPSNCWNLYYFGLPRNATIF